MTSESRTEALRAQLKELYGFECVPQWGTPRDLSRKTYGGKVAKVAKLFGKPMMPWQRYVVDVALEVDPYTGLLAYRDVVVLVPRQSGKTTIVLSKKTWRSNAWPDQGLMYAAQNRLSARKKWERDHVKAIRKVPAFRGKFTIRLTNGDEAINWHNGSWWGITSNTETAGHGDTLDDADIDEAFALEDDRLEQAFSPAMITRPQPQLWVVSTSGTVKSIYLNAKRERGREIIESGQPSRMAFFDWTVPHDKDGKPVYDRTDPALWRQVMPALGHTINEEAVQAELEKMGPQEFDRAYLNVTKLDVVADDPNVPSAEWPGLADEESRRGAEVAFAVDITPDRRWACIAVYSVRDDGLEHVELVEHREGTSWLLERLRQLKDRHDPIAIAVDAKGPGGALLLELEDDAAELDNRSDTTTTRLRRPEHADKPKRGDLAVPTVGEVTAAAAAFTDACRPPKPIDDEDQAELVDDEGQDDEGQDEGEQGEPRGTIRHLSQLSLNLALANAVSRKVGDAYAWGRRASTGDISPLVAVTLARWAYRSRVHLVVKTYNPLDNIH